MSGNAERHISKFAVALVVVVTAAAYWSVCRADFLLWDDASYVYRNRLVTEAGGHEAVVGAFTTFQCSNYHPLTMLSHWGAWRLFGNDPWGHHLVNLVLHCLNASLVFLLLRAIRCRARTALVGALLFSLHPVNVSVVAWVAERKELLCGLFFLLAVVTWVRTEGAIGATFTALFAGMALLSKPTAVALGPVLLGWQFCCSRQQRWAASRKLALVVILVASIGIAWVTYVAQESTAIHGVSLPVRLASVLHALPWYLGKLVVPLELSPHHVRLPHWDTWDYHILGGGAAVFGLVGVAAWGIRKGRPILSWGTLWFVVVLLPVLGIVRVGRAPVAERYLYLSQVGALVAALSVLEEAMGFLKRLASPVSWPVSGAMAATVGAIMLLFFAHTIDYLGVWQSDEVLWRHVLRICPDSGLARVNLAAYYSQVVGDDEKAKELLEGISADDPDGQYKLARLNLLILKHGENPLDPFPIAEMERLLEVPPESDNRLVLQAIAVARAEAARRSLEAGLIRSALTHCQRGLALVPGDEHLLELQTLAQRELQRRGGVRVAGRGEAGGSR